MNSIKSVKKHPLSKLFSIVFIYSFSIALSAPAEEELTLDNETPTRVQKPLTSPSSAQQKPNKNILIKNSRSQTETIKTEINPEYTKLAEKKEFTKLTELMWKKIDTLKRAELILLAQTHFKLEEFTETIKACNLVLAQNEKDEEAYTLIGLSQLKRKKEREAMEALKKATEINPLFYPALEGMGEIYEKRNNFYELRIIYSDLVAKVGEKSEYLTRLCDINTKDGVNDQAIEYCNKAKIKSPNLADNYTNLGLVYKNMKELPRAKNLLKEAAIKFPNSDKALLNYASFLEEEKNYIDSFKFYSACTKANVQSEKCWLGFTTTSYHILKFSESHEGLKKLCNFNRKYSLVGRKAAAQARTAKQFDWSKKIDTLSEICGN